MEEAFVRVPGHGYQFLALTATCKQILQECFPLYLIENEFVADIDDFDGAWTSRFIAVVREKVLRIGWNWSDDDRQDIQANCFCTSVNAGGVPNWQNLLQWLEACHKDRCVWWNERGQGNDEEDEMALNTAFGFVKELRGQPWDKVVAVLEHVRSALTFADSRWG